MKIKIDNKICEVEFSGFMKGVVLSNVAFYFLILGCVLGLMLFIYIMSFIFGTGA